MISALFKGYVTPWQIARIIRGNDWSLQAMNDELKSLDLRHAVPAVSVPVLFASGRYDRVTDSRAAQTCLARLDAASKCLVWFEESAHNVPFEEPDRFNETVVAFVKSRGTGRIDCALSDAAVATPAD